MATQTKQECIDQLNAELAHVKRELLAHEELHHAQGLATRHLAPPPVKVELRVNSTTHVIELWGLARASGGVAVWTLDGYRDMPVLIDDAIEKWRHDCVSEVRELSERVRMIRQRTYEELHEAQKEAVRQAQKG